MIVHLLSLIALLNICTYSFIALADAKPTNEAIDLVSKSTKLSAIQIIKESLDLMNQVTKILKTIHTEAQAEKQATIIQDKSRVAKALEKKMLDEKIEPTAEEISEIETIFKRQPQLQKELNEQVARLHQDNLLTPSLDQALEKFYKAMSIEHEIHTEEDETNTEESSSTNNPCTQTHAQENPPCTKK